MSQRRLKCSLSFVFASSSITLPFVIRFSSGFFLWNRRFSISNSWLHSLRRKTSQRRLKCSLSFVFALSPITLPFVIRFSSGFFLWNRRFSISNSWLHSLRRKTSQRRLKCSLSFVFALSPITLPFVIRFSSGFFLWNRRFSISNSWLHSLRRKTSQRRLKCSLSFVFASSSITLPFVIRFSSGFFLWNRRFSISNSWIHSLWQKMSQRRLKCSLSFVFASSSITLPFVIRFSSGFFLWNRRFSISNSWIHSLWQKMSQRRLKCSLSFVFASSSITLPFVIRF